MLKSKFFVFFANKLENWKLGSDFCNFLHGTYLHSSVDEIHLLFQNFGGKFYPFCTLISWYGWQSLIGVDAFARGGDDEPQRSISSKFITHKIRIGNVFVSNSVNSEINNNHDNTYNAMV